MAVRQSDGLQHLLQHAIHPRTGKPHPSGSVLLAPDTGSEEDSSETRAWDEMPETEDDLPIRYAKEKAVSIKDIRMLKAEK